MLIAYCSIIGIAAIGANPIGTWEAKPQHTFGSSFAIDHVDEYNTPIWITRDVRKSIPKARVLLYGGHGETGAKDRLKELALKLLECIHALRRHDVINLRLAFVTTENVH